MFANLFCVLLALAAASAATLPATGEANVSKRQATREQIVSRSTRTQPHKRQTSPGLTPPTVLSCGSMPVDSFFTINVVSTTPNGPYAGAYLGGTPISAVGGPSNAAAFQLDGQCRLVLASTGSYGRVFGGNRLVSNIDFNPADPTAEDQGAPLFCTVDDTQAFSCSRPGETRTLRIQDMSAALSFSTASGVAATFKVVPY